MQVGVPPAPHVAHHIAALGHHVHTVCGRNPRQMLVGDADRDELSGLARWRRHSEIDDSRFGGRKTSIAYGNQARSAGADRPLPKLDWHVPNSTTAAHLGRKARFQTCRRVKRPTSCGTPNPRNISTNGASSLPSTDRSNTTSGDVYTVRVSVIGVLIAMNA
jgi:hypothetical protein